MRLEVRATSPANVETPLLAVPGWRSESLPPSVRALDEGLQDRISAVLEAGDFRWKKGESLLLYDGSAGGPRRVLLLGLGALDEAPPRRLRDAGGYAAARARALRVDEIAIWVPSESLPGDLSAEQAARSLAEGLVLGAWRFDELRTELTDDGEPPVALELGVLVSGDAAASVKEGSRVGHVLAAGQNYARELVSRPANIVHPRYLAEQAQALGRDYDLEVAVLDEAAIAEEGMEALLAVAAGSDQDPRFITLLHRGSDDQRPVVLVGKGVTFDSGGLSLKSSQGMESMKYDMAGAAAVLGAMRAIAELELSATVVGLIPAVENLPSGHALRPGDVIRSHSGKTIEVLNTDAEGRLILADALSYASRYEPAAVVDVATLTGACVVALGHHAIGLMGSDPTLIDELRAAADASGERVWPLPLWDDYRQQLKSEVADIKNTGGRPAGTIVAGIFLKEFVGDMPWAHLDIAGTAWAEESGPYQPKGPTGVGVRLFTQWVSDRAT